MTYHYTCDICGREMEAGEEDGLVSRAQNHLKNDHGLVRERDVSEPNIAYEEEELRERIEEV